MNTLEFDIAIVGGGLVGASLALALADHWRVALIERNPPPPIDTAPDAWDNRVYAVSPGSLAFLNGIGGWTLPPERIGRIRAMDVRGDAGGAIHFDALDLAADQLAATVENRSLQAALWQALQGRAALLSPAQLTQADFGDGHVTLALADGRSVAAKLAVAADGAQSWLRQQASIGFDRKPYMQRGVVANFRCERPHGNIARQWFRDDGILAWLPLPGQRLSIVWSTSDEQADALLALPPEALTEKVAHAGGHALGKLDMLTPAAAFPLALGRAEHVHGKRLALVGDAAHTVHPLAGQGVNLGFGDAQALAALLRQAQQVGRSDPGDAMLLARYARQRAEPVLAMQTVCDGLQRLFAPRDTLLGKLRNAGLDLADHAGPLKRALMRQAFQ